MECNVWNGKKSHFLELKLCGEGRPPMRCFYQGKFCIFQGIYIYWALLKLQLQELNPNRGMNSLSQAECCPDSPHK